VDCDHYHMGAVSAFHLISASYTQTDRTRMEGRMWEIRPDSI
jgi:hypothetical protein